MDGYVARATTRIDAGRDRVWRALTDPAMAREYMFGTELDSDFVVGHPVTWRGRLHGSPYEDHGIVLTVEVPCRLRMTHQAGSADGAARRHTITYELEPDDEATLLTLTQDNAATARERDRSAETWCAMLAELKRLLEGARV